MAFANCLYFQTAKNTSCAKDISSFPHAPSSHFTFNRELFNSPPLSSTTMRGKTESTDASTSSDTGTEHVIGIQVITSLQEKKNSDYNPVAKIPTLNTCSSHFILEILTTWPLSQCLSSGLFSSTLAHVSV